MISHVLTYLKANFMAASVVVIVLLFAGWFIVQFPFVWVYGLFNPEYFSKWVQNIGFSFAQLGNAQMYPTLNLFVKEGEGKKFGDDIDESISHVSGVIRHEGRYRLFAWPIVWLHNYTYKVLGISADHLNDARLKQQ
jgi:hypothetical protein